MDFLGGTFGRMVGIFWGGTLWSLVPPSVGHGSGLGLPGVADIWSALATFCSAWPVWGDNPGNMDVNCCTFILLSRNSTHLGGTLVIVRGCII